MISTEHFTINDLQLLDAGTLSKMMVANQSRFQRDFPQTLAQNLTADVSTEYIHRKQIENTSKTEFTWAIRDNLTREVVGLVILKELDWERGIGEFAYCIGLNFSGLGWVTKAVQLLSAYALNELGLRTLWIMAHETNEASIRVAEKCGYIWNKKVRNAHTPPDGIALDMELYELHALSNEHH